MVMIVRDREGHHRDHCDQGGGDRPGHKLQENIVICVPAYLVCQPGECHQARASLFPSPTDAEHQEVFETALLNIKKKQKKRARL